MSRTLPISARIPAEDAEFLAELTIEGAVTPSDKLRAIIAQARQRAQGQEDFAASLQWAREVLAPAVHRIRDAEHRHALHSELVTALCEWLPGVYAVVLAHRAAGAQEGEQLLNLERALADRAFQLLEAVLRLGVTEQAPCYDKGIISARLAPILDLARVILATQRG